MTKRRKLVVTSLVTSLGLMGIQVLDNRLRIWGIAGLSVATLAFFVWSLREGLGWDLTLLTLVLPTLFTAAVGVFWFLLPAGILTRLPVILVYGVGIYALGLTMNVFTVGAIRTIALLRAARGVGFVLTLLTSFLVYDVILSFKMLFWWGSLLVALFSFPLLLQGYWGISLEKKKTNDLLIISAVTSLMVGEIALALFFWPVTLIVGSLFLTVAVYVLLGLGQAKLEQRLFAQTIKEYLLVGILVFIGMFIATHWGG